MKISIPQVFLSFCYVFALGRVEATEEASLRGSTFMDRELKKCNYECPKNSEEKPGRKCMDSFDDCACDLGYFKTNEEKCAAPANLCTDASMEVIQQKQAQVYGWLDLAKTKNTWEERIECINNLNKVLAEVWMDYNEFKASCEQDVDNDGGRRLGFFDFISDVGDFFVGVAEDVGEFVVGAVEDVGDFVEDVGEFAVGAIEDVGDFVVGVVDEAKCFLVGGFFKLVGFSADLALTVATGGANKLSKAACKASQVASKGKFLGKIAKGVSTTACGLSEKVDSDVLEDVCNFAGDIEAPNNRRILRFVKTFQNAVCGQPGKALGKILEDVVDCEIDCASQSNLFCGN